MIPFVLALYMVCMFFCHEDICDIIIHIILTSSIHEKFSGLPPFHKLADCKHQSIPSECHLRESHLQTYKEIYVGVTRTSITLTATYFDHLGVNIDNLHIYGCHMDLKLIITCTSLHLI